MADRRRCPECGRDVAVNADRSLRSHFSDRELGVSPAYMRMHCGGSGTFETTYEKTPSHGLIEKHGVPLFYYQSSEGWVYSLLIPTGVSPTHRMFEEDEAQAMIAALRASTRMMEELRDVGLSPETMSDFRVAYERLKRVRKEA